MTYSRKMRERPVRRQRKAGDAAVVKRRRAPSSGDGRLLRARNTHKKIIDALEVLVGRGDRPLTLNEVAREAGVAVRTVFVHFADFDSLWRESIQYTRPVFDSLMTPIAPEGPVEQRLAAFVASRSAVFEKQAPYRRAGNLMLPYIESIKRRRMQHRRLYRQRLRDTFGPELAQVRAEERESWFEALAAVADWDFWESLRDGQGLNVTTATAVWTIALRAALRAAAGPA